MKSLLLEQVSTCFLCLLGMGFILPNFRVLQSRGCSYTFSGMGSLSLKSKDRNNHSSGWICFA